MELNLQKRRFSIKINIYVASKNKQQSNKFHAFCVGTWHFLCWQLHDKCILHKQELGFKSLIIHKLFFSFSFRFFSALKRVVGGLIAIGLFSFYDPKFPASALYSDEFLVTILLFDIFDSNSLESVRFFNYLMLIFFLLFFTYS